MTILDYLSTPIGIELTHAVILLLLAATTWITIQTKRQSQENAKALDGHLESHKILTNAEHNHNP